MPFSEDGNVTITYTVKAQDLPPATTTTIGPADPQPPPAQPPAPAQRPVPTPAVAHAPLPYTGAPVAFELIGSFGLLVAGALTAWGAHRRQRSACRTGPTSAR